MIIGLGILFFGLRNPKTAESVLTRSDYLHGFCQQKGWICSVPKEWEINRVVTTKELDFLPQKASLQLIATRYSI
jgi:hypothetical protein